jgi:hypothetical protein
LCGVEPRRLSGAYFESVKLKDSLCDQLAALVFFYLGTIASQLH